jgi:translation elongation factor EF-G
MDTRDDEKERGITIKSTGVSLYYESDLETGIKFFKILFIFRYKIRICY